VLPELQFTLKTRCGLEIREYWCVFQGMDDASN